MTDSEQDKIREALDWLRAGDASRALDVLERIYKPAKSGKPTDDEFVSRFACEMSAENPKAWYDACAIVLSSELKDGPKFWPWGERIDLLQKVMKRFNETTGKPQPKTMP